MWPGGPRDEASNAEKKAPIELKTVPRFSIQMAGCRSSAPEGADRAPMKELFLRNRASKCANGSRTVSGFPPLFDRQLNLFAWPNQSATDEAKPTFQLTGSSWAEVGHSALGCGSVLSRH